MEKNTHTTRRVCEKINLKDITRPYCTSNVLEICRPTHTHSFSVSISFSRSRSLFVCVFFYLQWWYIYYIRLNAHTLSTTNQRNEKKNEKPNRIGSTHSSTQISQSIYRAFLFAKVNDVHRWLIIYFRISFPFYCCH